MSRMSRARARFLKIRKPSQRKKNRICSRRGAILAISMKIIQRNFEDVSSESAIFEDTNIIKTSKKIELSRAGAQVLKTQNLEF